MIDIQCLSHEPHQVRRGAQSRCQLAMGHEGRHALMFSRSGVRMIRRWPTDGIDQFSDAPAVQLNLPWALGLPAPAWFDDDRPDVRPLVTGERPR